MDFFFLFSGKRKVSPIKFELGYLVNGLSIGTDPNGTLFTRLAFVGFQS